MYSTRQIVWRKKHSFCLFQNVCKLHISISSFFQWYHFLFQLSISVNLKFQKAKPGAPVLINLFLWKYIYLSVSPSYSINLISSSRVFAPFLCRLDCRVFLRVFFLFVYRLIFISNQNLSLASKMQPLRQPLLNWL